MKFIFNLFFLDNLNRDENCDNSEPLNKKGTNFQDNKNKTISSVKSKFYTENSNTGSNKKELLGHDSNNRKIMTHVDLNSSNTCKFNLNSVNLNENDRVVSSVKSKRKKNKKKEKKINSV